MSTLHAPVRTAGPAKGVALLTLGLLALGLAVALLVAGAVTRWGGAVVLASAVLASGMGTHVLGGYSPRKRAALDASGVEDGV